MSKSDDQPVIDANAVSFSYGSRQVLNGLTLSVLSGEIFGVLGANGSGKTTFIRMLTGLIQPELGTVSVHGKMPSSHLARLVGYMPQQSALYLELSICENVDFFARMYGILDSTQRAEAVDSAIKLVNLWDRRKDAILDLSGGMRQRVSLAVALVHRPSLLLLDEPTVGLDPDLRANFWHRFREMASSGSTILLSSHTMDDAAHCHRLAFLNAGKVIALGTPDELCAATGSVGDTLEDAFLYFVRKTATDV